MGTWELSNIWFKIVLKSLVNLDISKTKIKRNHFKRNYITKPKIVQKQLVSFNKL